MPCWRRCARARRCWLHASPATSARCGACWHSCWRHRVNAPERPPPDEPRLTALSHGGGCGCKIAPGVLSEILRGSAKMPMPKELLVGIETADDAAVYQLNDE